MRTSKKHKRSILKETLPEKPMVRVNMVGNAKEPHLRQEATIDKVKRGRKRRSTVLETEAAAVEPEPEPNAWRG